MSDEHSFLLVKLNAHGDQLCVISSTWMLPDGVNASIPPSIGSNKFIRSVLVHQPMDATFENTSVAVILKSNLYNKARDMMQSLSNAELPSSDGTISMNLSPKRTILQKWLSSDEERVLATKRKQQPTACCYKKFVKNDTPIQQLTVDKPPMQPSTSYTTTTEHIWQQYKPTSDVACQTQSVDSHSMLMKELSAIKESLRSLDRSHGTMSGNMIAMCSWMTCMDRKFTAVVGSTHPVSRFPITSLEELVKLENEIHEKSVRECLSATMRGVVGITTKKTVRNIIQRLLTKNVGASMNYSGENGNFAFKKTTLNACIIAEVLQRDNKGEDVTFEITESIRSWLRDCKKTQKDVSKLETEESEVSYVVDLDEEPTCS